MTENEFRKFLQQNTHNWPAEKIENMIEESSALYLQSKATQQGWSMSEERANAMASLMRKEVATSIAMHRTGIVSKEDLLNHRIEKLPDDFPA